MAGGHKVPTMLRNPVPTGEQCPSSRGLRHGRGIVSVVWSDPIDPLKPQHTLTNELHERLRDVGDRYSNITCRSWHAFGSRVGKFFHMRDSMVTFNRKTIMAHGR